MIRDNVQLDIAPIVDYLSRVHKRIGGDIEALAIYCGTTPRNLARYFGVNRNTGRVYAKSTTIPLRYADELLTEGGDETVQTLWDLDVLDVDYCLPKKVSKCRRCSIEMMRRNNIRAKMCGFCVEETTGKTLTYRVRELY